MSRVIWSDLHQDLVTDSSGVIKESINIESVKTSIDNIVRTAPSERVFLPTFALGLGDFVFESINTGLLNSIASDIKNVIETWDDRVIVKEVGIKTLPDQHQVEINLSFEIRGYSELVFQSISVNL